MAKSKRAGERPTRAEIEGLDHLLCREDLLVAMRPAEPHEIVAQRHGQIAEPAIGIDPERAMALGELGPVRPMDQRDMRHARHLPAEGIVDLRLARRVRQMVVAADDVGDPHVVIVDDDREHVGRRAVGAQQHEIVEILVLPGDAPLHHVVDHGLALEGSLEADHRLDAGGASFGSRSRQRPS